MAVCPPVPRLRSSLDRESHVAQVTWQCLTKPHETTRWLNLAWVTLQNLNSSAAAVRVQSSGQVAEMLMIKDTD